MTIPLTEKIKQLQLLQQAWKKLLFNLTHFSGSKLVLALAYLHHPI